MCLIRTGRTHLARPAPNPSLPKRVAPERFEAVGSLKGASACAGCRNCVLIVRRRGISTCGDKGLPNLRCGNRRDTGYPGGRSSNGFYAVARCGKLGETAKAVAKAVEVHAESGSLRFPIA